jgi:hypothetical protein
MILIDYSQVAISNLHQQLKGAGDSLEPALLRHMILNSIRRINREFGVKYGNIVICTDNQNYWRKTAYRYYKSNRKKDRDSSDIDWQLVFNTLHDLRDEIKQTFPYKVINVNMAEADDVIAVLTKTFHTQEKILIISGDKDFQQLQVYPNVEQYSPVKNEYIRPDDPVLFLKEHIIRGDVGDGVPNFLSPDDVFVTGGRQKPIMSTKVAVWLNQTPEEICSKDGVLDPEVLKNYYRNKKLVDLTEIPDDLQAAILEDFAQPVIGNVSKIYSYLVKHRMKNLLELIREF